MVCDEPLYAHYLKVTALDHPGASEVMASHETDWRVVAAWLTGPIPESKAVFYQKHMAHHLLPEMDLAWIEQLTNCFLIRSPRAMITSLAKIIGDPTVEQTGLPQQMELFERELARRGSAPPVIDARDVLMNPAGLLRGLCDRIGVPFDEAMLSWPPGPRETDGVWARYWYDAVEHSTGFKPYEPKDEPVSERLIPVVTECDRLYSLLHANRITAADD